jgi:hypothetical protein
MRLRSIGLRERAYEMESAYAEQPELLGKGRSRHLTTVRRGACAGTRLRRQVPRGSLLTLPRLWLPSPVGL